MMFQTENSVYELRESEHLFRRHRRQPDAGAGTSVETEPPWQAYAWVTPITAGERVRIFLPGVGPHGRPQALTTSRVEAILTPA